MIDEEKDPTVGKKEIWETLKTVFLSLAPYRKLVAKSGVLALVAMALDMVTPVMLGKTIDMAGAGREWMYWLGAAAIYGALRYLAERFRMRVLEHGEVVVDSLPQEQLLVTLERLYRKPISFHTGEFGSKIAGKVDGYRHAYTSIVWLLVFDSIPAQIALLGTIVYIFFSLNAAIAIILLAATAAILGMRLGSTSEIVATQQAENKAHENFSAYGWDGQKNVHTVKSYGAEGLILAEMRRRKAVALAASERANALLVKPRRLNAMINAISLFAILAVGGLQYSTHSLTGGQMSAVIAYGFSVLGYTQNFSWLFRSLMLLTTKRLRLEEMLATPEEDYEAGRDVTLRGNVEFRGVEFRHGKGRAILDGIDLTVKAGERIAIVGRSGEGKTTLMNLLGRFVEPTSGAILMDGINTKDVRLPCLRKQIACVLQDTTLFHASIRDNLIIGKPDATDDELAAAIRNAQLEGFIARLPKGLASVVGENGFQVSGGERQRIAIARAFLANAPILVLDEATAQLDAETEVAIRSSLDRLTAGKTTFIVAHRLRTVREADLIIVLKGGKIAESGTHVELAKKPNGLYAKLLRSQIDEEDGTGETPSRPVAPAPDNTIN